jgi:hypothetical protein
MNPLSQMKTTPEIAAAIKNLEGNLDPGKLIKAWSAAERMATKAATVYSAKTQVRNFIANPLILQGNGVNLTDPRNMKRFGVAAQIASAIASSNDGVISKADGKVRELALAAMQRGVVDDDVLSGILHAMNKDGRNDFFSQGRKNQWKNDVKKLIPVFGEDAVNSAVAAYNAPGKLYVGSDNVFKLTQWLYEVDLLQKAYPAKPESEIMDMAAEVVTNEQPVYSKIPKVFTGGEAGHWAPIGLFVAFRAERIRNFMNWNVVTARRLASGNPVLIKNALSRYINKGAVTYIFGDGIRMAYSMMNGIGDDEEEAVRALAAPWDKDGALGIYHGRTNERGNFSMRNFSYQNPDGFMLETLRAMQRGYKQNGSPVEAGIEAAASFFSPWVGEKLVAARLLDAKRNATEDGHPVYNPQDSYGAIAKDIFTHVGAAVVPATFRQLRDVKRGHDGYVSPGGKVFNTWDEAFSIASGGRTLEINPEQAVKWRAKDYVAAKRDATYIYTGPAGREGTPETDEVLQDAYNRMENSRRQLHDELTTSARAGLLLRHRGGSETAREQIKAALKEGGVATKDLDNVIDGVYKPHVPDTLAEINQIMKFATPEHMQHLVVARDHKIAGMAEVSSSESTNPKTTQRANKAWADLQRAGVTRDEISTALYKEWMNDDTKALARKYENRKRAAPPVRRPKLTPSRNRALNKFKIARSDFYRK